MYLLLRAHASGGYGDTLDCDYAVVDVDLDDLAERYQTFMRLRHMDDLADLTEMIFFGNASFVTESEAEKISGFDPDAECMIVEQPYVNAQRTECDEFHVTLGGFYWACFPKHTDVQINTVPISVEDLKKLAGRD